MISTIEARNFRCLRYVSQSLENFNILIGPNASGKTAFLNVIAFLGQLIAEGLDIAVGSLSENFLDLVWKRAGDNFDLAIEAKIPKNLLEKLPKKYEIIRYEVSIGYDYSTNDSKILAEKLLFKSKELMENYRKKDLDSKIRALFPMEPIPPNSILTGRIPGVRTIVNKNPEGDDHFYSEVLEKPGKGWMPAFKFGPRKSAFANLPGDESQYPVATWLKELLSEGVQQLTLNSLLIRKASPPAHIRGFRPDGSNIPWVIERLKEKSPDRFNDWINHLKTALPDLKDIKTVERKDDRHRYLVICYSEGLEVPSWSASDGTLRLLALTLPAYLTDFEGVYLIEEPENGIHPRAVETMYQSLSSVYDAQILMATHSPVILSIAEPENVLCFAKTESGATDIVSGVDHPALKEWHGEVNLGVLYASGVLG